MSLNISTKTKPHVSFILFYKQKKNNFGIKNSNKKNYSFKEIVPTFKILMLKNIVATLSKTRLKCYL